MDISDMLLLRIVGAVFPSRLSTGLGEDVSHPKVEVVARWVVDQFVPGTGGTSWTSWTGVNGSRC